MVRKPGQVPLFVDEPGANMPAGELPDDISKADFGITTGSVPKEDPDERRRAVLVDDAGFDYGRADIESGHADAPEPSRAPGVSPAKILNAVRAKNHLIGRRGRAPTNKDGSPDRSHLSGRQGLVADKKDPSESSEKTK